MEKLLTIAIPTYNREKLVSRAVRSIIDQYDDRVEILVSDNASTDSTEETLKEISRDVPGFCFHKNIYNIGSMKNMMQCYQHASGKYILMLGSDDVITKGAIHEILSFIEQNQNLDLIFLNHTHFTGEYKDINFYENAFLVGNNEGVYTDKNIFASIVKQQLTFMSCTIVNRNNLPDEILLKKFSETRFLQACIAYYATKDDSSRMGVISCVCIAQDLTPGNAIISDYFKIFGENRKYVMCKLAVEYGYDEKTMKRIYKSVISREMPRTIIKFKIDGSNNYKNSFWKYGYPAIKEYPKVLVKVILSLYVPRNICKVAKFIIYGDKKQ